MSEVNEIELKLGGGRVVRTINGGEPEVIEFEFGFEDDYDEPTDDDEFDDDECGMQRDGGCLLAGTEFCDFECPYRDEQ